MATIIVCGSRNWQWGEAIATVLSLAPKNTIVVHGDALGADYLSHLVCTSELGLHPIPVPAQWDKYHRAAGPLRNKQMLTYRPKLVVGFHDQMWKSKGTRSMQKLSEKANTPFYLVTQTWLERKRSESLLSQFETSGLQGMVSLMIHLRSLRQGGPEQ